MYGARVHLVIKRPRVVKAALLQRERVGVAAHLHRNAEVSIRQHAHASASVSMRQLSIGIVKAALLQRERVGVALRTVSHFQVRTRAEGEVSTHVSSEGAGGTSSSVKWRCDMALRTSAMLSVRPVEICKQMRQYLYFCPGKASTLSTCSVGNAGGLREASAAPRS
jgi:hypothetical protein